MPFVPAESTKKIDLVGDLLLEVCAKTIFYSPLSPICFNVRYGGFAGLKSRNRLAVTAHIGVIGVSEQTQNAFSFWQKMTPKFNFKIFTTRATDIPIEVYAIGNFGHQHLAKAHTVISILVLKDDAISV